MATKQKPSNAEEIKPENVLALAAQDFACFCVAMQRGFELAKHIRFLIDRLEAVERGQAGLRRFLSRAARLLLSTPPRHGKTLLLALFIAWYLGRHPERSVIYATYGQDLSDDIGRRVRNLMADPLFQAIFPACKNVGTAHKFSCQKSCRIPESRWPPRKAGQVSWQAHQHAPLARTNRQHKIRPPPVQITGSEHD